MAFHGWALMANGFPWGIAGGSGAWLLGLSWIVLPVIVTLGTVAGSRANLWWLVVPPGALLLALVAGEGVFALFAMAAMGTPIYLLIAAVEWFRSRRLLAAWTATAALVLCLGYGVATVLAVKLGPPPEGQARTVCRNHLHAIGVALGEYHDAHRCYPPAVVTDGHGRPMHNWVVLLLPYLEHQDLYRAYNFRHAWDDAANTTVTGTHLAHFQCPTAQYDRGSHGAPLTDYRMVVCPGSISGVDRCARIADIKDGPYRTISVAECSRTPCPWASPKATVDLTRGIDLPGDVPPGASSHHDGGVFVLFAGGEARLLWEEADLTTLRALCTMAGGEEVDDEEF